MPEVVAMAADPADNDDDPSATDDLLELYWNSGRAGGAGAPDIWEIKRLAAADPWGDPAPVTAINSAGADSDEEVSADGLTMYFSSDRVVTGAQGGYDVFMSIRATRDDDWGPPEIVPELSSPGDDLAVVVSLNQKIAVLHSNRDGATAPQLYISTRQTRNDPWGAPELITSLDTDTFAEANPYITGDGLTLWFDSDRDGGMGDHDIYISTRTGTQADFGPPELVPELNSPARDADLWVSSDGHTAFLASKRGGDAEIYQSTR
jgi:WD40-like Beta Propeller Repeat